MGGGGGSRADCQKTALTLFLGLFWSSTYFTVLQWLTTVFISKKTIVFQGFRGAPTFSRGGGGGGSNFFQGGGSNFFQGGGSNFFQGGGGSKCKFL